MERSEIYEKLNEIFCDVLDLDEVHLTDAELEKLHAAAKSVRGALDGAGIK